MVSTMRAVSAFALDPASHFVFAAGTASGRPRRFRPPNQGLGFDNSPVVHAWRTMIRAANICREIQTRQRIGQASGWPKNRHQALLDRLRYEA